MGPRPRREGRGVWGCHRRGCGTGVGTGRWQWAELVAWGVSECLHMRTVAQEGGSEQEGATGSGVWGQTGTVARGVLVVHPRGNGASGMAGGATGMWHGGLGVGTGRDSGPGGSAVLLALPLPVQLEW